MGKQARKIDDKQEKSFHSMKELEREYLPRTIDKKPGDNLLIDAESLLRNALDGSRPQRANH